MYSVSHLYVENHPKTLLWSCRIVSRIREAFGLLSGAADLDFLEGKNGCVSVVSTAMKQLTWMDKTLCHIVCSTGFMCLLLWQCDHLFGRSRLETPVHHGWLKHYLKTLKLRMARKALSHLDTLLVVLCHSHANNLIWIWIWILVV